MPNHAHITVIGHLGKDPVFDDKHETARFSVAHTRKRKSGDLTTWYNVTAWRGSAKIAAQYLKKGDAVGIVGVPYLDSYTDRDGKPAQMLKIDANDVILMGKSASAKANEDSHDVPAPRPTRPAAADTNDDEPPF